MNSSQLLASLLCMICGFLLVLAIARRYLAGLGLPTGWLSIRSMVIGPFRVIAAVGRALLVVARWVRSAWQRRRRIHPLPKRTTAPLPRPSRFGR